LEWFKEEFGGLDSILGNISYILKHIVDILLDTCNLFPKGLFLSLVTIIIGISIYYFITTNKKTAVRNSLELIIFTIISVMSSFITFVLSLSSYYTGRLRFSIGATIGMVFIYLYCKTDIFEKRKIITYIIILILTFYSIFNVFNYINIMHQHKEVNILEKQEVEEIDKYIKTYEKENNVEVKYISDVVFYGYLDKAFYDKIENKSVITYSGVRSNWANDRNYKFLYRKKIRKIKYR